MLADLICVSRFAILWEMLYTVSRSPNSQHITNLGQLCILIRTVWFWIYYIQLISISLDSSAILDAMHSGLPRPQVTRNEVNDLASCVGNLSLLFTLSLPEQMTCTFSSHQWGCYPIIPLIKSLFNINCTDTPHTSVLQFLHSNNITISQPCDKYYGGLSFQHKLMNWMFLFFLVCLHGS